MGLLDHLTRWSDRLRGRAAPTPASAEPPSLPQSPVASEAAVVNQGILAPHASLYPPSDPGIPIMGAAALVAAQDVLVRRLRVHAALPQPSFDARFYGPITRMAAYVNALPATSASLFSGPGGLFRASIELAFGCFQASDGRIFTGAHGVEERHKLEVRWRYVCFLAGLMWPVGRTIESVKVVSEGGLAWPARVKPLSHWASEVGAQRMFCTWPAQPFEIGPSGSAAAMIMEIVGEQNLKHLEDGSSHLVSALIEISSGGQQERYKTAFDVVNEMWKRLLAAERARRPETYGRVQYGHHLAPHLVDLMCTLIAKQEWRINERVIWVDGSGIYLEWPQAALDMGAAGRDASVPGLPGTIEGMLAILEDSGLIDAPQAEGPFVEIVVDGGELAGAVKIKRPSAILPDYEPAAFERRTVLASALRAADPLRAAAPSAASALTNPPPPMSTGEQVPVEVLGQTPLVPPAQAPSSMSPTVGVPTSLPPAPGPATKPPREEASTPAPANAAAPRAPRTAPPAARTDGATQKRERAMGYTDLLPPTIRATLKPRVAETFGMLVKRWRDEAPNEYMRTVQDGSAFALEVMPSMMVSDVPSFLSALALEGYLFIDPKSPGKMLYDYTIPEGSGKPKRCFVVAKFVSQQLGM